MVKAIVERHGGTVAVDDAPLGGARLIVQLPGTS
jgi:signal transduction histidine kinase